MTRFDSMQKLCVAVGLLALAAGATAQNAHKAQYKLVDLGPSGPAGQPFHITNYGMISAAVGMPDGTDHSVIYFHGLRIDISQPGLLGANSMPFGNNAWGQVVGGANSNTQDPAGEDFCGFQTLGLPSATTTCLPYLWQAGKMSALPTLGGYNGVANAINDFGVAVGAAENSTTEPSCPTFDPGQMQFQQYQFKPTVWRNGVVSELATVEGDRVGTALAINNNGQIAGGSGACSTFNVQTLIPIHPVHSVFWAADGTPTEIQSLGGDEQSTMGTLALGINNYGQVVGFSSLSDDATFHGFMWTAQTGQITDLGTVPGVANSSTIAINDSGVAVGVSLDASHFMAAVWKNGIATDLNTLIPANSSLYLLIACSINSKGQIIGLAVDGNGTLHGYELDPLS